MSAGEKPTPTGRSTWRAGKRPQDDRLRDSTTDTRGSSSMACSAIGRPTIFGIVVTAWDPRWWRTARRMSGNGTVGHGERQ